MGWFFKEKSRDSGLQKGSYNSRCFGCQHYGGRNHREDVTSVICEISSHARNGVVGCDNFNPDQSAGCTGCAFNNDSCEKGLRTRFEWKNGFCTGFEKRNYYQIE